MMRPDFFILGAPKCGTSALAQWLGEHPQVFFCNPKEPLFWIAEHPELKREHGLRKLDDYLALFEGADPAVHRRVGEGSALYLRSERAVPSILDFDPDARLVVLLRDPVEVAQAYHSETVNLFREDLFDFEATWRATPARRDGEAPLPPGCTAFLEIDYAGIPKFGEQLARVFDLVPRDRVHVAFIDEMRADPGAFYAEALRFLDLEQDGRQAFPRVHASHSRRFRRLARLVLDPPPMLREPIQRLRRFLIRHRFGPVEKAKALFRKPERRAELRPEFERELRMFFAEDGRRLEQVLGRPVPWVEASGR